MVTIFRILFKVENYRGYVTQTVETPTEAIKLVSCLIDKGYSPEILYCNSDGSGNLRFLTVADLERIVFMVSEGDGADLSAKLYKPRTFGGA